MVDWEGDDPAASPRTPREAHEFRFLWMTGTWPETFSALRHRNFRLFWTGQLISLVGTWMQNAAMGWLIPILAAAQYGKENVSFLTGVVSALGSLPMFLLTLFAGVMADRHDRRRILVYTQTALMFLAFILAALTHFTNPLLWQVAIISVLSGTVMSFDMPTRQTFVKDMVGPKDLLNAIALNSSIFNGARIFGPIVAGALIALPWVGIPGAFLINGLSYVAVIIGLLLIRIPPTPRLGSEGTIWAHLGEGFRFVRNHRTIRLILVVMAIYSVFGFSYMVLLPVFAQQVLQVQVFQYTLMVATTGAGALVGALLIASLAGHARKGIMLLTGGIIFSSALLLLGLATSVAVARFGLQVAYWLTLAALPFIGGGLIISSATINSLVQELTPDNLRGRVVAIWAFIFAGSTPVGAFYTGVAAHATSPSFAVGLGGLICLVTAFAVLIGVPWMRTLE